MTAVDVQALQEGLVIVNLKGETQLVNLTELTKMTDDERKNDELVRDLGTLLLDPKTLKIVNGMEDLMRFAQRVHFSLETDGFVALRNWHPDLGDHFMNTVKREYPQRYETLTLGFRGERHSGWRWGNDPEVLNDEQLRLMYALSTSLVSLTLDGIMERTYGQPVEQLPPHRLGECVNEILQEENLLYFEGHKLQGLEISKSTDKENEDKRAEPSGKKVRFPIIRGATTLESLAFGMQRKTGKAHLLDKTSPVMIPRRHHVNDLVEWEESLELLHVVPAMPLVWEKVTMPEAGRSILKKTEAKEMRFDRNYTPDPDLHDRGHIRFPNLNTSKRIGVSRTASPPPRPDDPDKLREENRRRRRGLRPMGPPCKPGVPEDEGFVRGYDWERSLPDDAGLPFGEKELQLQKRRPRSPINDHGRNKKMCGNNQREQRGEAASERRGGEEESEAEPRPGPSYRGRGSGRPYHGGLHGARLRQGPGGGGRGRPYGRGRGPPAYRPKHLGGRRGRRGRW